MFADRETREAFYCNGDLASIKFKMADFSKIDVTVFDKVNITLNGAELKTVLGEWFAQITETFLQQLEAQHKEEKYLTAEETAQMLGVDKNTLWRWDKCNYLPKVKIDSKVRYRQTDIKELMKKKG